ncbi:MAG: polysaccharide pyruvyl transferase family protein [Anaerostipes sp.]|nr:polysaccharide pyruvyl transferase family protein [Anaerostipes sp.]
MEKIGILTLYYNNDNYGGIAQAYALQKYIETLGYDATLISYKRTTPPMLIRDSFSKNPIAYIQSKMYNFPCKIKQKLNNKIAEFVFQEELKDDIKKRKQAFQNSRMAIKHSEKVYTDETIVETVDMYDCFISGSDQIWKPGVIRPAYVCDFLPLNKKCFSYASSITVTKLPQEYGEFMKRTLSRYQWISVREKEGKEYLQNLLDRKVDVVVDPTLLLPTSMWEDITKDRIIEDKYIFVYLLGQSRKQRDEIKKYAKKLGVRIVYLPHVEGKIRACDIGFGDVNLYDVDLSQFFSLIKYAEMIFTDSFHAVVFSIVFKKKFWVFDRVVLQANSGMGSRLSTLLNLTQLTERKIANKSRIENIECDIDYNVVSQRLQTEVERSQLLLKKALED